jgi:probable HAF family extracellular repeat protein
MIDLGTLGGNTSVAYAINARGQVVGESVSSNDKMHAFLFADSTMRDLNSMVDRAVAERMTLISGRGISDRGWILVNGVDATSDETRSYLLRK